MVQKTTKGFPYPIGTDRVMDGDDAIHALATAVDLRSYAQGTIPIAVLANGASVNTPVALPAGWFTAAPLILLSSGSSRLTVGVANPTNVGFTFSISNWSGAATPGPVTGYWIAFGLDPIP